MDGTDEWSSSPCRGADAEADVVWLREAGMTFHIGTNEATELTEACRKLPGHA